MALFQAYCRWLSLVSNSKYFSFMELNAKAAAAALNTEKSKTPLIPVEKPIDIAKISKRHPLNLAKNSVLKPTIMAKEKMTSIIVITMPIGAMMKLGNQGFINCVYSKKELQSPQIEMS